MTDQGRTKENTDRNGSGKARRFGIDHVTHELVLGSIRSYRRSRYLLTRPVSRIVLSPLLQLVSSRRFAGLLQRSPGQFECALQRSQRDVPPRLHEPFRDVEIVGDLRCRPAEDGDTPIS